MENDAARQDAGKAGWGCETDDLYLIHAIFRTVFGKAEDMVRNSRPTDAKQIRLVSNHLKEAFETLHNHHAHEDNLYWDLIKLRAPEAREDVNRMIRHHEEIAKKIEENLKKLNAWSENPAQKDELLGSLSEFKEKLFHHLEDEETNVKPVAARVLTQKEWNKARSAGIKEIHPTRILYQIGYMVRCAPTQELRDEFLSNIPGFMKMLYRKFGQKKFEKEWAQLYGQG